jgi:hypothetical protein
MSDKNVPETSKEELLNILDEMITSYSNLPREAMIQPITHWEHESLLILIREMFKNLCIHKEI